MFTGGNICTSIKLDENDNAGFFGIHFDNGLETIGTPEEVFHFNDGVHGTVKTSFFFFLLKITFSI